MISHLWQRPWFDGAEGRDGFDMVYDTWEEFITESLAAKGTHPERNILYGWNWGKPRYGYRDEEPFEADQDTLFTYWILPFKNVLMTLEVTVSPNDEDAVRTWLTDRAAWLSAAWWPVQVEPGWQRASKPRTGDAP